MAVSESVQETLSSGHRTVVQVHCGDGETPETSSLMLSLNSDQCELAVMPRSVLSVGNQVPNHFHGCVSFKSYIRFGSNLFLPLFWDESQVDGTPSSPFI